MVWNSKGLQPRVAKIQGLQNQGLKEKLNFFIILSFEILYSHKRIFFFAKSFSIFHEKT